MSTIFIENKSSYVKLCDPKSFVKDLLFYYKKTLKFYLTSRLLINTALQILQKENFYKDYFSF